VALTLTASGFLLCVLLLSTQRNKLMQKLILTSIILTISLVLRTQGQTRGQIRGDSIFGTPEASTNLPASVPPGVAKTNLASGVQTRVADGSLVGFDKLAGFAMPLTDELVSSTNSAEANSRVDAMIPANIRALDHRNLSVEGFMVPVEFDKDKTVEFILVQAPFGCCFGAPPQIHELIRVRVKPPGISPVMFQPARARGTFHVGAQRESGVLSSIYRMEAEVVTVKP